MAPCAHGQSRSPTWPVSWSPSEDEGGVELGCTPRSIAFTCRRGLVFSVSKSVLSCSEAPCPRWSQGDQTSPTPSPAVVGGSPFVVIGHKPRREGRVIQTTLAARGRKPVPASAAERDIRAQDRGGQARLTSGTAASVSDCPALGASFRPMAATELQAVPGLRGNVHLSERHAEVPRRPPKSLRALGPAPRPCPRPEAGAP